MQIEQLGPYRLVRPLGRGGMGTVYHGLNTETEEPAAVKLLATGLAHDEGFRERFAAEIETLKKLNHPNVVRLFGFGRQGDLLYYAMELVDGSSLEEELRRGRRFSWREVSQVGIQTARALRHAHDRGVIHRDLKPGNLLLAADGTVKLSDFGIARLFGNAQLTAPGNVVGTVEYMAPEQAAARPVGPRGDLYSLGAVMYVLLTGKPVFRAESLIEAINKHQTERPEPVAQHAVDVPEALDGLVMQLLQKDPEARVANAALLIRRLEAMEHALSVSGQTVVRPTIARASELALPKGADGITQTVATEMRREQVDLPTEAKLSPDGQGPQSKAPVIDALAETRVTDAFAGQPVTPAKPEPQTSGEFVEVGAEDLDPLREEEQRPALVSLQTWILAILLLTIGIGAWYLLQPPTADDLYEQIIPRAESESIESLLGAQDDIEEFLMRFPEDPRVSTLREYLREIDLHRLQRKFDLRMRGFAETRNLLPIEQAYLEAMQNVRTNPERSAVRLEALLALYGQAEATGPTGLCLQLARRRLEEVQSQIAEDARQHLAFLEERMQEAERRRVDRPSEAQSIYEAIIELYHEKPWAADRVRQAKEALKNMEFRDNQT